MITNTSGTSGKDHIMAITCDIPYLVGARSCEILPLEMAAGQGWGRKGTLGKRDLK